MSLYIIGVAITLCQMSRCIKCDIEFPDETALAYHLTWQNCQQGDKVSSSHAASMSRSSPRSSALDVKTPMTKQLSTPHATPLSAIDYINPEFTCTNCCKVFTTTYNCRLHKKKCLKASSTTRPISVIETTSQPVAKTGIIRHNFLPRHLLLIPKEGSDEEDHRRCRILLKQTVITPLKALFLPHTPGRKATIADYQRQKKDHYDFLKGCVMRDVAGYIEVVLKLYFEGREPRLYPIRCTDTKRREFAYIDCDGDLIRNTEYVYHTLMNRVRECFCAAQYVQIDEQLNRGEAGHQHLLDSGPETHNVRAWQNQISAPIDKKYSCPNEFKRSFLELLTELIITQTDQATGVSGRTEYIDI